MNISTWTREKKILAALIAVFFLVGIVVTVYLVQRQQQIQSHAQKATVLELSPPNQSAAAGGDANVNVSLNPGTNQVNFVKVALKVDANEFDPNSVTFTPDDNSPLKLASGPTVDANGDVVVTLNVGADPTKVVQSTTPLGSFDLPVKAEAIAGETNVNIDQGASQVRSVGSGDAFNENVLQSVVNVKVTITAGECVPNKSTCSWDASDGATSYHYQVVSSDSSTPVTEGDTPNTSVTFDSVPGKTYSCAVTASNDCGTSGSAKGTSTCPAPSLTPIPTTPVTTETPTPSPSPSPSPSPVPTTEVTPTTPVAVTATPIPTNVIVQGPTTAPRPTLPATGNPVVTGGIIGGVLFVLGGLALLLL